MRFVIFTLLLAYLNTGATSTSPKRQLTNILCRISGYKHGNKHIIEDGIKYLRAHDPQQASICHQPGGGCCARVSCDQSAAIYVCNDNTDRDVLVSLSDVADHAQAIVDTEECVWVPSSGHVVQGQAFDDGGWNVIVGIRDGDSCSCCNS
ncbi:hypothetical protein Daus18300_003101 [Diaporthe australafricana]|uniref:Uncharacterized protein n=1 Tax=Diaporthe australafricana TaxID=127596 RepID=A0ABR3XI15_9PEZI